jgi:SAM-dependent methyltransferase
MRPQSYSFARYLAAKKSVDDRALNRRVWGSLARTLPYADEGNPLQVLEIGAGIGVMIERALEWSLLTNARYTAVDVQPANIRNAGHRLRGWAQGKGYRLNSTQGGMKLSRLGRTMEVELVAEDFFAFAERSAGRRKWDLLIAHAFLDLVDLPTTLPLIFDLIRPGGCFYFSLNFDGVTILEPELDPRLDEAIFRLYHRTMDERALQGKPSGDSRTGRHLFTCLREMGVELLDAGASDWVVFPETGGYAGDDAYFLHTLVHTIHEALEGHPELDADRLAEWTSRRHAQIEAGELVMIAHQMDFVGAPPLRES